MILRYLLFLCFTLFLGGQLHAQDSIPDSKEFSRMLFKKHNQHTYTISPNGKYFTHVIEDDFESRLVVVDIDAYNVFKDIPLKNRAIGEVKWLDDTRIVYESAGEIFAIDKDGENKMVLASRFKNRKDYSLKSAMKSFSVNRIENLLPDEPNEILIQTIDINAVASLERVNVYTGQRYVVLMGRKHKMDAWMADHKGRPKFAIKSVKDEINIYKYDSITNTCTPFSVNLDSKSVPFKIAGNSYLEQKVNFEDFSYVDNIIYLSTNVGSDKRRLISYNYSKGTVESELLSDPNTDISGPLGEDLGLVFDPEKKMLAGVRYQSLLPQYRWFSSDYKSVNDAMTAKYPGYFHEIPRADKSLNRFVVFQWNDVNEGNIGIYDRSDDSYAVMFHFNPELNEFKLEKSISLIAKTKDGAAIPCYLSLPKNTGTKKVPLIVIPHGGPWARDYWDFDPFVHYFTSQGFATLKVNFRGSTGFGKKHLRAGLESIDKVMIEDIYDATQHAIATKNLDADNVFIYGHSYGGYATYMELLKHPEIFKAGVAVSAPSDLKGWMKTQKKAGRKFAYNFWAYALGSDSSKYLKSISPYTVPDLMNSPLLIFHGRQDRTIPVEQSEKYAKALQKEGKDVKIEIFETAGHSISNGPSIGYLLESAAQFFKNHTSE